MSLMILKRLETCWRAVHYFLQYVKEAKHFPETIAVLFKLIRRQAKAEKRILQFLDDYDAAYLTAS